MNRELIEKWIAALRSGEYKQAFHQLRSEDTYCYYTLSAVGCQQKPLNHKSPHAYQSFPPSTSPQIDKLTPP